MPEAIPIVKKGGRTFRVLSTNDGRVERLCDMACCSNKPKYERYTLLPCGCHSTMVRCTCRVRERHCNKCLRNFIQVGKEWFEIADPHAEGQW